MSKNLLILERSEANLTPIKEDGKYVLEGVFTEIGVKNKNNRIYDKVELMPHIKDLQEQLKGNKLLGELDHPTSFDISLKNASHIIESLTYDESTNKVMGRIRLLNTSAGKEAMALVDAGVPLHISSRAAGSVTENNHVKIKKMFTYDLVANPGFQNAELSRVNESYGFGDSPTISIYEIESDFLTETNETQNKIKEMDNKEFISVEDFNAYSKYMKEQVETIKTTIRDTKNESTSEEILKLTNYVKMLSETVDNLISHNDYIVEGLESVKDYANYIKENTQNGINYSEKLAESLDSLIDYTKMVAEKTDQSISYTEGLSEKLNQRFDYQNYVNESVDNLISHNDHIVEGANKMSAYQTYLAEHLDNSISHGDYIVEGVQSVKAYAEYLKENTQNAISYMDFVVGKINEGLVQKVEGKVNESSDYKATIASKLDALIANAKESATKKLNESKDFTSLLSESSLATFNALDGDKKEKVAKVFEGAKIYTPAQADHLLNETIKEPLNEGQKLNWLVDMPQKYIASWNSLNEGQKQAIKAQASIRSLNTEYQINDFWATRDLREVKPESLNESIVKLNESVETSKFQNSEYMEKVAAEMKRRFNR